MDLNRRLEFKEGLDLVSWFSIFSYASQSGEKEILLLESFKSKNGFLEGLGRFLLDSPDLEGPEGAEEIG